MREENSFPVEISRGMAGLGRNTLGWAEKLGSRMRSWALAGTRRVLLLGEFGTCRSGQPNEGGDLAGGLGTKRRAKILKPVQAALTIASERAGVAPAMTPSLP
jgi:hypothetical protein